MLTKVATKVFVALKSAGHTVIDSYWESPYEGDVIECKEDVEDHVHDNTDKDQWVAEFKVKDTAPEHIQEIIESVYGKPTRVHEYDNRKVNNWEVKGVLIVHLGDSVEFHEDYKKTPRRK